MDARDQGFARANPKLIQTRQAAITSLAMAVLVFALGMAVESSAAQRGGYRTANFIVNAPTTALAKEIGDSAEAWRKSLAIEWIGKEMPAWGSPCTLVAKVAPRLGAGGATTFMFDRGEVYGWEMEIQGSRERVLDSVLPHEITHTVFATYFRKPLPRWADEGACTTVEHLSEVGKQERLLIRFLKSGKGIPFNQMFAMKEYPPEVLPLYAQGHSLTQFLLERRGKPKFMDFLSDGMQDENWRRAVNKHYGHESLWALQEEWNNWVRAGRPRLPLDADLAMQVAANPSSANPASASPSSHGPASSPLPIPPTEPTIIRGQGGDKIVSVRPPGGPPSVYSAASANEATQKNVYDASRGAAAVWR